MPRANRIHVALFGALLIAPAACKKHQETEPVVAPVPSRPPSPSGTMSLRGNYSYIGNVGTFQDCTVGGQWRVAREGDHEALEGAYVESNVPLGSPLLVTVEGGIDVRPSPDAPGEETMLIVTRFVRAWPGRVCDPVMRAEPTSP